MGSQERTGKTVAKMIEIINGSPTTLETLNLALLGQKIENESKKYSPLLHKLLKCCERFQSSVSLLSSSLSDVLRVMTSLSNICLTEGSSGLTLDIGNFLSEDVIKQSDVLDSLGIFDVQFSDILKNIKEKTKILKERKYLLKKTHSKNIKLREKDIRNFNKIERNNKNKKKFVGKEKDFHVANLLLNCKNLEDREKLGLVEMAGLERNLFSEYLLGFKQILLLQRELFSTPSTISCSVKKLDQLLQSDTIAIDAVSGVLSVSRNKSTTENEAENKGTQSPSAFAENLSESEWSQSSDRTSTSTSAMFESSSESLKVSLRKSDGRFSTVRRRSASPVRGPDYVARSVPCSPPVIQPGEGFTRKSHRGNTKSSQSEDYDDDYEVSFYMNNMADGEYFSFDRIKDEVI